MVISAVRAPLRSSTVLMAMVEPCSSSDSAGISQWASARLSATPRVGSAGTVEVFEVTIRPSTQPTRSVKVPPISTPTMFMRTEIQSDLGQNPYSRAGLSTSVLLRVTSSGTHSSSMSSVQASSGLWRPGVGCGQLVAHSMRSGAARESV